MPPSEGGRFLGRRALVTGAATGLGREICRQLLDQGASVAMSHRPGGHVDGTQALVREFGAERALAYGVDLADATAVREFFDSARADLGGIDLLVNNAGIWPSGGFADIPVDDWDWTFAVNCRAPFLLCQRMIRQDRPALTRKIVNITSQAAFHGSTTGHAHYAASKAALVTMTVSLARETAGCGVTANCVALGMMDSNMVHDSIATRKDYYLSRIPLGRIATPEDITPVVLFLLGPDSDYMTGATIDATGGMLMR
ncbi:MAG: SDR family oxidoreductase [Actinomyces sp.]|nr:SDR family oxidoreductase [Actinomyces sp.]MCI1641609.1 SDR family oxidoreductase [Actinomyces sp.]MCI1661653.1 SDR family oxidoreductase [Actinomyces sp.]MCI1691318.1 SDR family oxidoreductase [Actinomyces sp.]MCI1787594.1 SDR family oxidoreductase [Actinomyces sp.]MCI1830198.1 SDR family oxidoreductase [Actinomyces sp.]